MLSYPFIIMTVEFLVVPTMPQYDAWQNTPNLPPNTGAINGHPALRAALSTGHQLARRFGKQKGFVVK